MKLIRSADPAEFLDAITPALGVEEARHSLILGVVARLLRDPAYAPDAYLVRIVDGDQLILAVMRTPPFGLVLAAPGEVSDEALSLLIEDIIVQPDTPPDVNASKALCARFSQVWAAKTGGSTPLKMAEGLYELNAVNPATLNAAPGRMRPGTLDDLERFQRWREGFEIDAFGAVQGDPSRALEFFMKRHADVYFWEDSGEPVSMALRTRPSVHGISVSLVYTPSEHRKKGYATALVAHLSQHLLDSGYQFCTLYTDLANLTSNHIYQEIGYRHIEDVNVNYLRLPGDQHDS